MSYCIGNDSNIVNHVRHKNKGGCAIHVSVVRSCFVVTETSQRVFPYLPDFFHKKKRKEGLCRPAGFSFSQTQRKGREGKLGDRKKKQPPVGKGGRGERGAIPAKERKGEESLPKY